MNRLMAGFLVGFCYWFGSVYAHTSAAGAVVPTIRMLPDGSLPADGSQCVMVDSDGIARVNFAMPHRKRGFYDDNPHFPRSDVSWHDDGFEYDRYGVYLSVVNAQGGRFWQQQSRVTGESVVYQEVVSSGNAGKQICFKTIEDKPVPSYFEFVGRYFSEIFFLNKFESFTGGAFNNFLKSGFSDSIPAFMMLHNQLEMGKDMQQLMQVQGGMSSAQAGISMVVGLKAVEYGFSPAWYRPITDLGASGAFILFYSAPMMEGALNGIDDGLVTPVGELISPADGTDRQPGSLLASVFFRGPLMLSILHRGQSYWNKADMTGVIKNHIPLEMFTLTIVTTSSTRTFITDLDRNFLGDNSLLGYLHDGVLLIAIASVDDPSNVITIYFDENIKGMSIDLLNTVQGYSDSMKSLDDNLAWGVNALGQFVVFGAVLAGGMATIPVTGALLAKAWGFGKLALDSISTCLPAVALVSLYAQKTGGRLKALGETAGAALRQTGKQLGQLKVVSKASALVPATVGTGQNPVYWDADKIIGKACGLTFTLGIVGPGVRRIFSALSQIVSDASLPGSPLRYIFQSDRQIVIGHYVRP